MVLGSTTPARVRVDGKFFRLGETKFYPRGVTYGPFAAGEAATHFPSPKQTARDFAQIRELGANLLRVYHVPPRWLLDLAAEHGLRLLIDVPWNPKTCFLESEQSRAQIRQQVRDTVNACIGHPAVFAYSVGNEIPPEMVRWSGERAVADFLDELVETAKAADPDALCTFTSFPPTEYLRPQTLDFVAFNVYLHHRRPFENYLARLQMQADGKPLLLAEFGLDSQREGEAQKCQTLAWQIEAAFRAGLAGVIVFSFTDDWVMHGRPVEDWSMGLTGRDRQPKDSFFAVQAAFRATPYFPLPRAPRVSVVVACYNGARTLKACLSSLTQLRYPDYEVILVDDGSTDATPQIASLYPAVRYIRQPNHGLSVARNTGIAAATGEIVAFTDADCRADEDWLYYLVGDLVKSDFAGMGGHNFLPPEDSAGAAAVLVSPGGPAHVMLTDHEAEHIPGCNMAFYKWALEELGGFDPVFRKAGDDVDVCWRLQQRGHRLGFCPAGFVWHYRRPTIRAYLRQQSGYGEAEALLVRKHPEYFNLFGGSRWRGRIYSAARLGVLGQRPIIYRGVFGTGFFQTLYSAEPAFSLMLCTSLEYYVLIALPLFVCAVPFPVLLPVAVVSVLLSFGLCATAAAQADLPRGKRRFWSRPLVALLFFLQPIVRGWARYQGRLALGPTPPAARQRLKSLPRPASAESPDQIFYRADGPADRIDWVKRVLARLDQQGWTSKADAGWSDYDIEIFGNRWSRLQLSVVTEPLAGGKTLFRCRLRTAWSLPAKIAFWSAFGLELLIVSLVAPHQPWLWMLLLTMPVFAWFLEQEQRDLQWLIAALLDDLAGEEKMTRVEYQASEDQFVPAAGA